MKKLVCIIAIMCLIPMFALSDSITEMSYDELISMHQQLVKEIMSRPEWKEVTVPAGIWVIGEDIPAGTYSLTSTDEYGSSISVYADKTMDDYDFVSISGKSPLGKYTFAEGMVIDISRAVIFAPPVILGF